MRFRDYYKGEQCGFTLVEIVIAMAMASFVLAGAVATYTAYQRAQANQDRVVEMQQNIRSAMVLLTRDIREAGCDPNMVSGAGIVTATVGQIRITRDIAGHAINPNQADGDTTDANEDIIYSLDPVVDSDGAEPNGIPDTAEVADFCRNDWNGGGLFQPIAQNIERLEFRFLDVDGAVIPTPIISQSTRNTIHAVQVSMLVRASREEKGYFNADTYTTAAGTVWGPFNDGIKRRYSSTTIQCRNTGF